MPLEGEHLIPLANACKLVPGCPVHWNTIRRWSRAGYRGVRLETVRVGLRLLTSEEAVRRFVASVSSEGGRS